MTTRASLISFYSPPRHLNSPEIQLPGRILSNRFRLLYFKRSDFGHSCLASSSEFSVRDCLVRLRKKSGRVWADVKSKSYDVSDPEKKGLKFEEALKDVVKRNAEGAGDEESIFSEVPWLEQFPKRWVIVLLCFSAFLLCNMDRVKISSLT